MDGWRVRLLFLYFLPALPYYWLKCWVFLKDRSMQKLNAHSQNEADMSLWLWGWISFEGTVGTKWGRWGLAVEFPVETGSFKTQIKQGGNAQRMNMNWCWALPGLASFDKAHFLIACQLFTLLKYVSSDEHASPETDTHGNTHVHQGRKKGVTHQSIRQIMSGWTLLCSVSCKAQHPFSQSLMHSLCCPCRRASSPQNNLNAGSAQRRGNVSTRQEPRSSLMPLLIFGTWNCLSAR